MKARLTAHDASHISANVVNGTIDETVMFQDLHNMNW